MRAHSLLALLWIGCGSKPVTPTPVGGATYYQDVEPILHERCVRCHQPNNVAPFSLLKLEEVMERKSSIATVVREGRMPPMPAKVEGDCPDLDDPRLMPQAERDTIVQWIDSGAAAGQPTAMRPPPSGDGPLGPPTHSFTMPVTYEAPTMRDDDYRCFVIDPQLTEPVPVRALSVRPGNAEIVHHASVYLVPPTAAAEVRALEAADPQPGYSCFGGVGLSAALATGGWVPGLAPVPPPRPNLGGWLYPGWLMVMQVHYNFGNAHAFQNGPARDQSTVVAWRSPTPITEIPAGLLLGDWTIVLPAGQSDIERSVIGDVVPRTVTPQLGQVTEGLVYSTWAHEHLLGKSFKMELLRQDGSSQCLLSIPKWDFHWQGMYPLKTPLPIHAGDRIKVTCRWDNSSADPVHNPPHEVHFGESTADEMCIGTLAVMQF
jgi:hypothetical protein